MLTINKDDYIILRHRSKPTLCFVLNAKSRRAVVEKTLHLDEPENITYEDENVLANLGANPVNGKVFGVDVTPYVRTINSKKYGPIHLFRNVPKKELKALRAALDKMFDKYDEVASTAFLPLHATHVLPKKGKYAGCYIAKSKGSEVMDVIKYHPETLADPIYNEYLVAHEFAHGLWYRCVPLDMRARWIKLYQKRMTLTAIKNNHLEELFSELARYEGTIRDYSKEVADDAEKLVIKEVFTYFKRYHRMSPTDVELLLTHDSGKLGDMWPNRAMLTEGRADLSQYALTNVEEFFAEAVSYHMVGKTVPKDVKKALTSTFKKCRR